MGNCWGAKIKAESPSYSAFASGTNSKYGSREGKVFSSSSSKVSVPPTPRSEDEILQSSNVKSFTFNELKTATRNFRPDSVLGEGGFGSVFKGWVDEHTFAPTKPGTGMVIAVKKLNQDGHQAAKGLAFLHSDKAKVIYRDFKASNVLLDSVSYLLACSSHLTTKSDVYSFGVVLLELLSGRHALDRNRPTGEHNLVEWAKPFLASKRRIFRVLDARLGGQYPLAMAQKAAFIALQCLSTEARHRLAMDQVVSALEELQNAEVTDQSLPTGQMSSSQIGYSNPHRSRRRSAGEIGNVKVAYPGSSASPLYA
ncbi:hypothetical protein GW17_00044733 [Ensete ventricosum]|nr:hypothetical protein GW17_00044733 [Ensete ventricosum]